MPLIFTPRTGPKMMSELTGLAFWGGGMACELQGTDDIEKLLQKALSGTGSP